VSGTRWIENHTHTHFQINGEVAVVDGHGIVAATESVPWKDVARNQSGCGPRPS